MKHFYFFLFFALFFGVSTDAFAQEAGDYRSNGDGTWNASIWSYYNGTSWVTPPVGMEFPGKVAGNYNVYIRSNDEIRFNTAGAIYQDFGLVFVDGRIEVNRNTDLRTSGIIMNAGSEIEWTSINTDLRIPADSYIDLNGGVLIEDNPCSANKTLTIGNEVFASCNGGGADNSFEVINKEGGTACINDSTAPVPDIPILPALSAQCQINSLVPPTASDLCDGVVTGTTNVTLPITSQGTSTITWTYQDSEGNISTQQQQVVIEDTLAPTASAPANATYYCSSEVPAADITLIADASDNCSAPTVTFEGDDSSVPGQILRTYRVTDASGNFIDLVQTLTISEVAITFQPVDTEVAIGYDAQFTVAASNSNTFQWQVSTNGGTSFTNISIVDNPSAGTATLLLTDADPTMDGYQYRVEVGNSNSGCPSELSDPATLLVYAETVITNRNKTYRVDKYPDP